MAEFKFIIYEDRELGAVVPMHYHDCYEFVYYENCSGEYSSQDVESIHGKVDDMLLFYHGTQFTHPDHTPFQNRTVILTPPHTVHRESHTRTGKVFAVGFMPNPAFALPHTFTATASALNFSLPEIIREFSEKKSHWQAAINGLLDVLCVAILRCKSQYSPHETLFYIKNYIDNYYMTDISVAKLAAMANFSKTHFTNLFAQEYGTTPKAYLTDLRMKKANSLLENTHLSITEIAAAIGFSDINQFSAFYKKKFGVSPGHARKP